MGPTVSRGRQRIPVGRRGGLPALAREALAQADRTVGDREPLIPGLLGVRSYGVCHPPAPRVVDWSGNDAVSSEFAALLARWKTHIHQLQDDEYGYEQLRLVAQLRSELSRVI